MTTEGEDDMDMEGGTRGGRGGRPSSGPPEYATRQELLEVRDQCRELTALIRKLDGFDGIKNMFEQGVSAVVKSLEPLVHLEELVPETISLPLAPNEAKKVRDIQADIARPDWNSPDVKVPRPSPQGPGGSAKPVHDDVRG
jgi:hypothetical protein